MNKDMIDYALHAAGGLLVALVCIIPVTIITGVHGGVLVMSGLSGVICATIIGYFRELEQHHCNGGGRWDVLNLSKHKHIEALAWPVGALLTLISLLLITY